MLTRITLDQIIGIDDYCLHPAIRIRPRQLYFSPICQAAKPAGAGDSIQEGQPFLLRKLDRSWAVDRPQDIHRPVSVFEDDNIDLRINEVVFVIKTANLFFHLSNRLAAYRHTTDQRKIDRQILRNAHIASEIALLEDLNTQ